MEQIYFDFKNLNEDKLNEYKEEIELSVTNVLNSIVTISEVRNFSNTVQPMINIYTLIEPKISSFHYASNFYTDKQIRSIGSSIEGEIEKFLIECGMRKDIYFAFKEYEEGYYQQEKFKLSEEENRYFNHTLRDFRRNGLHLDNNDELKQLKKELSEICVKFKNNINEENTSFNLTKSELDGLPNSWFNNDRFIESGNNENNENDDIYRVTLKYPDYIPVMQYAKDRNIRKKLYCAYSSRCSQENVPLFEKAVKLRFKIAKILGYETYADYKTEIKIIKNAKNALDFENELNELFTPLYKQDMNKLFDFAKNYKFNPLDKSQNVLQPWDINYYSRAYKEEICNLDMEKVKEYFPLDTVKTGLFNIYQHLLGVIFKQIETDNKWHESVELYSVVDKKTDDLMGYFYLDMHPREGKYSHAAAFSFQTGCDMTKVDPLFKSNNLNRRRVHIMTMACNFPNGCISFSDVETFFHEFGHIMHQICSKSELKDFSGFGVEWDFVEAPSQMLEYWCYCEEPLKMMSSHKDSGEHIPIELIRKLEKMKKILRGYHNKRQLTFGLFDLKAHMIKFDENNNENNNENNFDSRKLWYENEKYVLDYETDEQLDPVASFGHLMGGYDAGYYGYLRSETYAANMFYKWFKNGNVLNEDVGMRYRKKLLEPGSTKDGIQILTDFLGEDPDNRYFLIDNGLEQNEDKKLFNSVH